MTNSYICEITVHGALSQGATGMKAMGIVMKIIQPETVGRVDGTLLANKVKEKLS